MNKYSSLLKQQIKDGVWTGYVTYYPHKRAYRDLKSFDMKEAWEGANQLNLYVHIPFCNRKCSFCNLFSSFLPDKKKEETNNMYVEKLLEEIDYYKDKVNTNAQIMSVYFGGGTPNMLSAEQLGRILSKLKSIFPNWDEKIEVCTESAPDLLDFEYMKKLKQFGFHRISVGVQSMLETELKAINRPTDINQIYNIRAWALETGLNLNFDLIYGLPHQTEETFFESLNILSHLAPESLCVYPLAIRPYTGISYMNKDFMMSMKEKYMLYQKVRKQLEKDGYHCQTIVRFVKSKDSTCQQEQYEYEGVPTLGLGAGARSYSPKVNYCITYKTQASLVNKIIEEYMATNAAQRVFTGYIYQPFDNKIKFSMLNLLEKGVNRKQYYKNFNSQVEDDFAEQFEALQEVKLVKLKNDTYNLTRKGMQYCDLAANIFVGENVKKLYETYEIS